ncbi:hypothetical protein ACA910_006711 [Epithemia clementina (nom. ined.)]
MSSNEYRHQPLSQEDDCVDSPISVSDVEHVDASTSRNGKSSKFAPLEIVHHVDDDDDDDDHHHFNVNGRADDDRDHFVANSPPASSALSPIMSFIAETEEKRKLRNGGYGGGGEHRYHHVIAHDEDYLDSVDYDDDSEFDDDLSSQGLDGVVTVQTSSCCSCFRRRRRRRGRGGSSHSLWNGLYIVGICLLAVLFAAVVMVPKQKRRRRKRTFGGRGSGAGGSADEGGGFAYARSCRVTLFESAEKVVQGGESHSIHSWQAFQSTMEKNQNWCRAVVKEEDSTLTCTCTSRVQQTSEQIGGAGGDDDDDDNNDKVNENVEQNVQAMTTGSWDVVFLGDERISRWIGQEYGKPQPGLADNLNVFDSLFTPSIPPPNNNTPPATVSGLAVGVTNDECPNLCYRVSQPYLTPLAAMHHPPIWWIVIGNNDVRQQCSYQGILAGILSIVSELQLIDEKATIVINSLLPPPVSEPLSAMLWKETIQPLNEALRCYVAGHEYDGRVHFLDVTNLFWVSGPPPGDDDSIDSNNVNDEDDSNGFNGGGRNETLFVPAKQANGHAYPNALGYQVWGQATVAKVQEILKKRQ